MAVSLFFHILYKYCRNIFSEICRHRQILCDSFAPGSEFRTSAMFYYIFGTLRVAGVASNITFIIRFVKKSTKLMKN
jgi:hypothetical protein